MTAVEDESIGNALTAAGWGVTPAPVTLTALEAAGLYDWTVPHVNKLCQDGRVEAVRVGRFWLIDGASVETYRASRRPGGGAHWRTIPAGPLLRIIEVRGGRRAVGVQPHTAEERALDRAVASGRVTVEMGDRLAVRLLGLTPWEVWGAAYDA